MVSGLSHALLLSMLVGGRVDAAGPPFKWATSAGGYGDDGALGLATDGAGGTFIAGNFEDIGNFGLTGISSNGGTDGFLAHVTGGGTIDWAIGMGGTDNDQARAVAPCSEDGGAFATGFFTGSGPAFFGASNLTGLGSENAFVTHVDAAGNVEWATGPVGSPGSSARGLGIATDGADGAFVVGQFHGSITCGSTVLTSAAAGSQRSIFVMRVGHTGSVTWAVAVGGSVDQYEYAGVVPCGDADGGVLVTSSFEGTASFGSTVLTSIGTNAFVMHVQAAGNITWAADVNVSSSLSDAGGYDLASDGAYGAYVTGLLQGAANFGQTTLQSTSNDDTFVMHVGATGVIDWAVRPVQGSPNRGHGIAADGAGGVLLAGSFEGAAWFGTSYLASPGGSAAYLLHLDAAHNVDWANIMDGDTLGSAATAIMSDGAGGAFATGYFHDSIGNNPTLGAVNLSATGTGIEAWVAPSLNLP